MKIFFENHRLKFCICFLICILQRSAGYAQYATNASIGSIVINGDIEPVKDALNFISFGVSRELKNDFLIESKIGFGRAFGLNPEFATTGAQGGNLVEEEYAILGTNQWYPAYRNNILIVDLCLNYRPEIGLDWARVVGGVGVGVMNSNRSLNLLGLGENFYTQDFSTLNTADRIQSIKNSYDITYETPFETGSSVSAHMTVQLSVQFRMNDYLYLNIEGRHHFTTSDYLDVVSYSSPNEKTGNNDSVSMLTIGFVGYLSPIVETNLVDN